MDTKDITMVRINKDLLTHAKKLAALNEITLKEFVERAVQSKVNGYVEMNGFMHEFYDGVDR